MHFKMYNLLYAKHTIWYNITKGNNETDNFNLVSRQHVDSAFISVG